ncbi:MAG TPA: hypothetical protein V6C58_06295 [Allocoleopsis sp.]
MNRTLDMTTPSSQNIPADQNDKEIKQPKRKMTPEALEKLKQARMLALQRKQELKDAKQIIKEQERKELNEKAKHFVNENKISSNLPTKPQTIPSIPETPETDNVPTIDYKKYEKGERDERLDILLNKISKIDKLDDIDTKLKKIDEVNAKFDIMMEEKAKARKLKEQTRKDFYNQIPVNVQKQMMEDELQQKEVERFRNKWFGSNTHIRGLKF